MPDRIRAVILCEDRQQEVFARYFLKTCGIQPIRVQVSPAGKGSGEQFVRKNYPQEVRTFRSKSPAQRDILLIVLTDADVREVADRFRQLEGALEENGTPERQPKEHIGVFIPKRNIETWIHYLMGQAVNEEDAYPYLKQESDCKPVVQALARNRREPLPEIAPPSLKTACQELPRIFPEDA
jgi:hypothetical protein